ncbi:MAG: hypothetical protein ACTSSE_11655 [Candidatus Thorarchaeota archaeon]
MSVLESEIPENSRKPVPIAVVMLLLGLFAPFLVTGYSYEWMSQITIQSYLWTFSTYGGFSIIPLIVLPVMFPLLLMRLVPVLQIYRYYNGKTTRKRTYIVCLFGDGFFLFYGLLFVIIAIGFGGLLFPLPFQLLFGWIILWRFPVLEPTTPWESESKPKSWWEKDSDPPPDTSKETQEKPTKKDDDNELW